MFTKKNAAPAAITAACLLSLTTGCGEKSQDATTPTVTSSIEMPTTSATDNPTEDKRVTSTYQVALPGASVIPYPMYPNATKYRIGGENGLKIVVFETEDTFESVDAFFQHSRTKDLARLQSMDQYVRYAAEETDNDPWATHRPGIVIHHFADNDEAVQYGAAPESRTNIIMSYR